MTRQAAFALHPRLAADTMQIGELPLSRLLLMNDARFPWCILVPRRQGLRELHELDAGESAELFTEIRRLSVLLLALGNVDKLNVGALGNRVPQLHVHVIARRAGDAAWPDPVWGRGAAQPYTAATVQALLTELQAGLGLR
ncbi:MAG: HIT domain-containing protein [Gammaproteobacteria bacterium]|nr:MAG: HIT domain-containing protein [Gammaproteobacteria bacterium]